MIDARVVFLTHYIPLYQVRVLQAIADQVRDFHVLVSTPIEPNRDFSLDWSGLNVTVQDTWTIRRQWRHRGTGEFSDSLYIHFPYDTGRQLRSLKPDVVMSLELGARSLGAARYCWRHSESKLILCTYMSEQTEQYRGRLRQILRRRLLRAADAITYNGPSCKRYLSRFDVPNDKLFHLPYAADDRTLHRGTLDRDETAVRNRFIVVGQLSPRKGAVRLVEQVADYVRNQPNRKIELVLVGDGEDRSAIAAMSLPPNLSLQLLGNIPSDELGQIMMSCGAMIAPTLADEWMLVVNEALQAGLPVIGSQFSQAVTTLVNEDVNGWQYDPTDANGFHRTLDRYFAFPDVDMAEMRIRCRKSVAHTSPRWAASGAIEAIERVLGHPNIESLDPKPTTAAAVNLQRPNGKNAAAPRRPMTTAKS